MGTCGCQSVSHCLMPEQRPHASEDQLAGRYSHVPDSSAALLQFQYSTGLNRVPKRLNFTADADMKNTQDV